MFDWCPKYMTAGKPSLLHGRAGQRGKADHVTRSVDMCDSSLEEAVHFHAAALVSAQAGGIQIQLIGVCLASHGI
jgi:hypothetical protein